MKKTIFSMALCLILILSGCAQRGNETPEPALNSEDPPVQTGSPSQSGEDMATPITVSQADWSSIQGKIKGIYPAGGSKVLVLADQMSLYDLASGKVVATAKAPTLSTIRVLALDNGYAIVGQTILENSSGGFLQSDSQFQFRAIIYDKDFILKSEIDISKLVADGEFLNDTEAIAVSPDGNSIAFATMQGVTLYECPNKKRTKLIDLTGEDEKAYLGLSIIEQVGFTNNGRTIAFKAQSFDIPAIEGKPSFGTIGKIDIDGTGLVNQKTADFDAYEVSVYDSILLVAENFTAFSGRIMVVDNKFERQKIYNLTDKKESKGVIYGSDNGHYFATSVLEQTGWTIRVYETDSGNLVKKENISNDGQELYGINDPMICVLDDTKTCMVLLGHKQKDVSTKIASFSF